MKITRLQEAARISRQKLAPKVMQYYSQVQMPTKAEQATEEFFSAYPTRTYRKGQILFHASDDTETIYYLVSGRVKQYDVAQNGEEIVVNLYKPGSFFPLMWPITGLPNRYFFEVDTDCSVRPAPYKEVLAFLKANPEVMYDLIGRLYKGLDGVLGRMVRLMAATAKNRMLYELLIECRRFSARESDGSYRVDLLESELAARAGLSRETVSRQLQLAAQEGIIRLEKRTIIIPDIDKLETKLIEEI